MLSAVAGTDRAIAATRPAWGWLGELGVVVLGVHLVADRIDDWLGQALLAVEIGWPSPEAPLIAATWCAVAVELLVVALALRGLLRAAAASLGAEESETLKARWKERWHLGAVALVAFWLPTMVAGCWVVGMAIEDALATWLLGYATPVAWIVTALVALRLGATGLWRITRWLPMPKRRIDGFVAAPLLLGVGWLALRYGLPIWGWLA